MKKYRLSILLIICTGTVFFALCKTNVLKNLVQQNKFNKIQVKPTEGLKEIPKTGPILPGEKPINSVKPVETEVKPRVIKEVAGLVSVTDIDNSLFIDLKYSTADNFTGKVIYPVTVCLLQKETAQKLMKANTEFKEKGYKLKIWDAYRPVYVQKIFWDIVKDSRFVANPAMGGSIHNRGTAVDLTLLDSYGDELKMPSKFDDFSANAYRNNSKMDSEARKNMNYLTDVMKRNGFKTIDTEWWHFEDSNSSEYKIVDVKLDEFLKKESLPLN